MPSQLKWALSILVGLGIIVIGFRWLPALLTTFFVLNCLVLIVVVLLQSGKAADLAGAFGGNFNLACAVMTFFATLSLLAVLIGPETRHQQLPE